MEPEKQYPAIEPQILFEISMSIGNSLDLKAMLKPCLSTFLKRLNCIAGGVYQLQLKSHDKQYLNKAYTIPRQPERNETYDHALKLVLGLCSSLGVNKAIGQLPLVSEHQNGRYYHILPLPDFGLFILVKNKEPLQPHHIKSLNPLLNKLAAASIACTNEAKLRQSEEIHRVLLKSIYNPILALRRDDTILFCNDAFSEQFGVSISMLDDVSIEDLYPQVKQSPAYQFFQEILETGEIQELEEWQQGKYWQIQGFPTPWGVLSVAQDATERKQMELAREKLIAELESKNAELERFTYTVSHDLKSPLITIKGFIGYIEQSLERGDLADIKEDLLQIAQAADNMYEMLNDLLELSRIGRLVNQPVRTCFGDLVAEAIQKVDGRLKQNNVNVVVQEDLPEVVVDVPRVIEALQNLIDNAAKFSQMQPEPLIEIGAINYQTPPIFFVKDNGVGIKPQYQERVFELFHRLEPSIEGTGIGLTLVRRIIELHHGKIWVESEGLRQGATFFFTLPDLIPEDV